MDGRSHVFLFSVFLSFFFFGPFPALLEEIAALSVVFGAQGSLTIP